MFHTSINHNAAIDKHRLSREFRTGVPWELLYADDLVVIADSLEECISKLRVWKAGMESKGLRVRSEEHTSELQSR